MESIKTNYLDQIGNNIDYYQICRLIIIISKTMNVSRKIWKSKFNSQTIIQNDSINFEYNDCRYVVQKDGNGIDILCSDGRRLFINFDITPLDSKKTGSINIRIVLNKNTSLILNGRVDWIKDYGQVEYLTENDLKTLKPFCRIMSGDKENTYLQFFDLITDDVIGNSTDESPNCKNNEQRIGKYIVSKDCSKIISPSIENSDIILPYLKEAQNTRKVITESIKNFLFDSEELDKVVSELYKSLESEINSFDDKNIYAYLCKKGLSKELSDKEKTFIKRYNGN